MSMNTLAGQLRDWPTETVAVAVIGADGILDRAGPDAPLAWASVTKLLTALTVLRAADTGTISLDEPAGPPGSTIAHLLAHTSGLSLRGGPTPSAKPGERRVYSNAGYELLAEVVQARTGAPFADTVRRMVLAPLGMGETVLAGSAASGAMGPIGELAAFAGELLRPRRLPAVAVTRLATTAFPGLSGELPGYGEQAHNDWGLGAEVRNHKSPHWTAPENSPKTFGHFGRAGGFCWVDPGAELACVSLSDTDFGPWAVPRWPRLSSYVLTHY